MDNEIPILLQRLNVLFQKKEEARGEQWKAPRASDQEQKWAQEVTRFDQEFDLCWACLVERGHYPVAAEGGGFA